MIPRHKLYIFIIVLAVLIVCVAVSVRANTFEIKGVWPTSLHSVHAVNPEEQNQDNGGNGFILTWKHDKKWMNFGIGKIFGTNSYGNPLEITILQFCDAGIELSFLRLGVYAWKLWIKGYYDQKDRAFTLELGPWPVFYSGVAPLYFIQNNPWARDIFIEYDYISMFGVSASFVALTYRRRF